MQVPLTTAANAAAWAVLIGLIGMALVMVVILGSFGLIFLGLCTLFVRTSVSPRDDAPTWGPEVFTARMARGGSPEQRAAMVEERARSQAPLQLYRWCGVVLIAAGISGSAWQQLR